MEKKGEEDALFQFHKGTIRTSDDYRLSALLQYFNSIKVRLEQRLDTCVGFLAQFQFHKGTIRTKAHRPNVTDEHHFNSIKVRLER